MGFNRVKLRNFRNFEKTEVDLNHSKIYLIGKNGQGKTNFLESLYFLCYGSSFRTNLDKNLTLHNGKDFSLYGEFFYSSNIKNSIKIEYKNSKKSIYLNEKLITDRKELIDTIPCIVFCHNDINFVEGPPEKRRWFFDQVETLVNGLYFEDLRRYKKILRERNTLLKQERGNLLKVYDIQLAETGLKIQSQREAMVTFFNTIFSDYFKEISQLDDTLSIEYKPSWSGREGVPAVLKKLDERRERDLFLKTTTTGPHRDDYKFIMGGSDFIPFASTGQKRLISLILRSVQAKYFSSKKSRKAILLLDDVLLELDSEKREKFLELIPEYDQIYFTFFNREGLVESDSIKYKVEKGSLTPL